MKRLITKSPFYTHIIGAVFIALFGVALYVAATPPVRADDTSVAAGEHIIALHDDGAVKGFITKKATLKEALADANIAIDANDRTEPALDTKLVANSYQVNIYRARPVVIKDGLTATKVITSYRTGAQIAKHAGLALHDEDKAELSQSTNPLGDGASEIMTVTRATPFTFDFYGKTSTSYSLGKTVGDMLNRKHITLAQNDVVVPGVDTPLAAGLHVRLYREGTQTVTQEEEIPFETEQIKDANRDKGYKETKTLGKNGKKNVTYEIIIRNGKEESRKEVNSTVTVESVKQVEIIGTKVNLPAGSHEDWMAAAGISPSDYGYVNYIVGRESRWRYNARNKNAYGLCQANPGDKMDSTSSDWETNPITQLKWCSGYAAGRYGSWGAAYNHWLAHRNW